MQKRYKVILFVLCYSLGLFAVLSDLAVACSCVLFLLLIFLLLRKIITDRFAVILFLIFAVGFFNCSLRLKDSDLLSTYAPANEVKVTGKVTSLPVSASDDLTKFILDAEKFELNKFEKFEKAISKYPDIEIRYWTGSPYFELFYKKTSKGASILEIAKHFFPKSFNDAPT